MKNLRLLAGVFLAVGVMCGQIGAVRAQVTYAAGSIPDRQQARYRAALDLYDQLTTLFPQSPTLGPAQVLYDRAYAGWRASGGAETAAE